MLLEKKNNKNSIIIFFSSLLFFLFQIMAIYYQKPLLILAFWICAIIIATIYSENSNIPILILFLIEPIIFFIPELFFIGRNFVKLYTLFIILLVPFIYSSNKKFFSFEFPYIKYFSFVLLSMSISLFHSFIKGRLYSVSIIDSIYFIIYILYFYLMINIINKKNFLKLISYYFFSAFVFLIIFHIIASRSQYALPGRISIFEVIDPNKTSMYLELFFPLSFFMAINSKNKLTRIVLLIFTISMIITILLTYSKGGILAILFVFGWYFFRHFTLKKMILGVITSIPVIFVFFKGFSERLNFTNMNEILSSLIRLEIYKTALKMAFNNFFIFGYGFASFKFLKFDYGFPRFLDPLHVTHTHNFYLSILVSLGIIGFLAFFYIIFKTLKNLFLVKEDSLLNIKDGLFCSIIAFLIHNMVDHGFRNGLLIFPFMVLLAFSYYLSKNKNELSRSNLFN